MVTEGKLLGDFYRSSGAECSCGLGGALKSKWHVFFEQNNDALIVLIEDFIGGHNALSGTDAEFPLYSDLQNNSLSTVFRLDR